jgi:hypothetical protein
MDKHIIDVVNDFPQWKGDTYRLAALIAEEQKRIDAEKLEAAEMHDAAEIVRS